MTATVSVEAEIHASSVLDPLERPVNLARILRGFDALRQEIALATHGSPGLSVGLEKLWFDPSLPDLLPGSRVEISARVQERRPGRLGLRYTAVALDPVAGAFPHGKQPSLVRAFGWTICPPSSGGAKSVGYR